MGKNRVIRVYRCRKCDKKYNLDFTDVPPSPKILSWIISIITIPLGGAGVFGIERYYCPECGERLRRIK